MSAGPGRLHEDERGAAMVLVALWLVALVSVSGLVADGGTLLAERRALQNAADAAAAAGAMQLDESRYRASGGSDVSLDGAAARRAAEGYLAAEGGLTYTVRASGARVEVEVARRAPTVFLRVVRIDHVTIRARASAEPRHGVVAAPGAPRVGVPS
ncbi:MAG: pilus assembly protein TadG-related protein [Chloroflexi bacterium]|nr:pilus assembly protein TadG-related protein [Chloroflexota bacterium]